MRILLLALLSFSVMGEVLETEFILKKVENKTIIWDERNEIHSYIKAQIRGVNPDKVQFKEDQLNFFADGHIANLKSRFSQFKKEYVTALKSFDHEGNRYSISFDYVNTNQCQLQVYKILECGNTICGKTNNSKKVRKDVIKEKYCDILYGKR